MNIVCGKCGQDSGVVKTGRDGADAARVQHCAKFVVKLPVLIGINEWFFACSDACMKQLFEEAYAKHNVTGEMRAEAREITDRAMAKIPEQSREVGEKMARLARFLRKVQQK